MGRTITKVSYICDCGENYGSCGVEAGFIQSYNRSCDIGTIYYYHRGITKYTIQLLGAFGDNGLFALSNLLNINDDELDRLTDEEFKEFEAL